MSRLKPAGLAVKMRHLKPRMVAQLHGPQDFIVVDPHGKPPRGVFLSLVKIWIWLFEEWYSTLFQEKRGTLLICDRYYHDLLVDPVRYRYDKGMLDADTLADPAGGQWGLTHDDYGRLYYSSAGGEIPALNFEQKNRQRCGIEGRQVRHDGVLVCGVRHRNLRGRIRQCRIVRTLEDAAALHIRIEQACPPGKVSIARASCPGALGAEHHFIVVLGVRQRSNPELLQVILAARLASIFPCGSKYREKDSS